MQSEIQNLSRDIDALSEFHLGEMLAGFESLKEQLEEMHDGLKELEQSIHDLEVEVSELPDRIEEVNSF